MHTGSAVGIVIVLGVLLLFSAFSATETAFASFSQARLTRLAPKKESAKLALKLSRNYNKIPSTLLIGNNIVNIAAASPATLVFALWFGDLDVTLSTMNDSPCRSSEGFRAITLPKRDPKNSSWSRRGL